MTILRLIPAILLPLGFVYACGGSDSSGSGGKQGDSDASTSGDASGSNGGGSNGGGSNGGASGKSGGSNLGGQTLVGTDANVVNQFCGGDGCTCSNGKDDDGDGLVDGFDPECTGPLDNDEGTFATGIPGDNVDPKWQDCFFDGNSGAGDDGCRYSTKCLTGELPQSDKDCAVAKDCQEFCGGLTPNGCDCFGCCTIFTGTGSVDVTIGTDCSVDKIGDEAACPRCTKSTGCGNTCGECELCLGKTVEDLPATCRPVTPPDSGIPYDASTPPPPAYTCDNDEPVCTSDADCPTDSRYYCQLGCCLEQIF